MPYKEILEKPFDRPGPLFERSKHIENDRKIKKIIESTQNMNIITSLIPFFTSDELRDNSMKKYREYMTDTSERKPIAYSISSIVSEPKKLKEMIKEYKEKVKESGEELAIVIASFESMKLKLKLMEMLLHRRNQGIVMASLPEGEESKKAIEQWKEDNHYSDETVAIELEQGSKRLYNKPRRESKKYGNLDFAAKLDLLSNEDIPREDKYEIIDALVRPTVFRDNNVLNTISDIDPEVFDQLHEMMVQTGKPLKECLKITCEYNDGRIAQREEDLEAARKVQHSGKNEDVVIPETPGE